MKPFDLARCIAGDPVITRNKMPYKFGAYNPDAVNSQQLVGWIDGVALGHYTDGHFTDTTSSDRDLFMAPATRTVWVAIVSDNERGCFVSLNPRDSEELARVAFENYVSDRDRLIKIVPIEIEE